MNGGPLSLNNPTGTSWWEFPHSQAGCERSPLPTDRTPLSDPVIWELSVINEVDRNGSPRFKVC